ncbi:MAG: PrsW family glutamic-type intramembrane protease, partial [bacterium]
MSVPPIGLFALTLIPVAALTGLFLMKAKPERGMWMGLGACFIGGLFVVFPGILIEKILATVLFPSFFNLTSYEPTLKAVIEAFLIAAVVEESLRFLVLYFVLQKNEYLQTRFHGLLYGALTGLGFALMENLLYLQWALGSSAGAPNALQMTVGRSNFALAAHTLLGMIMGYFFLRARRGRRHSEVNFYLGLALAVPFVLHGLYDLLALASIPSADAWILGLLAAMFGLCIYFGLTEPVPHEVASMFDTILDDSDPVNHIQQAALTLQQKKDLCQELLIQAGIKDYLLTDLVFSEHNILVLKAIRLKDFRVEAVKMISTRGLKPEGVVPFSEWVAFLKGNDLLGILPYTDFQQKPRFVLVARIFANTPLKDYAPSASTEAEQADIIFKTAEILQALWKKGVVHGRLTPENIFIHVGEVRLGDVGLHALLAPRERHRTYLPGQELPMDHHWDLQSIRAVTDWLTRGRFAMKLDKEEPRYPELEAPETPVTALAPAPPSREEMSRILLQKAEKMERNGMVSGATGALILLRRAALARSDPELQKKIERFAMEVYREAHEAIQDYDASLALRKMAQFMEVLPEQAEVAAADVESLAEKFVRQGDTALLRHDDRRRAELYYRQALQIQPNLDVARKKIQFLYRPPEFSFESFAKFVLIAACLLVFTLIATGRLWRNYDVMQIQGFNPQRTGATINAIGFKPQFKLTYKPVVFDRPAFPELAFSGNSMYLVTTDGKVHALGLLNGIMGWAAPIQEGSIILPAAAPLACGDKLAVPGVDYFVGIRGGSGHAGVFVLNPKDGSGQGELPLTSPPKNILCYRNNLFAVTADSLVSYSLASLDPLWQLQGGAPTQPALLSRNVVYVAINEKPAPVPEPEP